MRLTFTYEGEEVSLASRQPVEMIAPPTDQLSGYEGEQGFWIEVRTDREQTLHRRVMHNPLRHDVEVFSPDPERPSVSRVPLLEENPSGSFVVVVPELDEADHLTLMSSAAPSSSSAAAAREVSSEEAARAQSGGPATEFARFSLRPPERREGGGV